jgi:hypothetical protein
MQMCRSHTISICKIDSEGILINNLQSDMREGGKGRGETGSCSGGVPEARERGAGEGQSQPPAMDGPMLMQVPKLAPLKEQREKVLVSLLAFLPSLCRERCVASRFPSESNPFPRKPLVTFGSTRVELRASHLLHRHFTT